MAHSSKGIKNQPPHSSLVKIESDETIKDMFSRFIPSKLVYINLESHIQILSWLRKFFSLSLCQGH